jgi:LTXXQ motif family protein
LVTCRIFALIFLNIARSGFAEDPIVVHYSDPSLARMEAQIGITPAQKTRFEDIVVAYRDSQSNAKMDNSTPGTARTGRHGGGRGSVPGEAKTSSQGEATAPFAGRPKSKVSREELDELATILTPAQIKKFQDVNGATGKKEHSS